MRKSSRAASKHLEKNQTTKICDIPIVAMLSPMTKSSAKQSKSLAPNSAYAKEEEEEVTPAAGCIVAGAGVLQPT